MPKDIDPGRNCQQTFSVNGFKSVGKKAGAVAQFLQSGGPVGPQMQGRFDKPGDQPGIVDA